MDQFQEYLTKELSEAQRKVLEPLFEHILTEFPDLQTRIAWNQPMFTDHGTFILGISSSKKQFLSLARSENDGLVQYPH